MRIRSRFGRVRAPVRAAVRAAVRAIVGCGVVLAIFAMADVPSSAADEVEVDPIKCWWGTDKTSLHVGERFSLTLTCGVVETNRVKVVADPSQLEPTAVSLAPFEVVGGTRHKDIQAPPWRYFQYEYTLRVIGDAYFGKDVDIPPLKVTYRIQSAVGGGAEGREQTHVLPALSIRVMSLVPKKAADIRDGLHETFGDIEARRSRATAELVGAAIFFGFALVTLGLAGGRVFGRYRQRAGVVARPLPTGTVLRGCLGVVRRLKSRVASEGWTPEMVARALTVFRVVGAVALRRPVAQALVDTSEEGREGQLALPRGMLRRKHALVSTPTTPRVIAKALDNGSQPGGRASAVLADIQNSLSVFSAARYGRNGHLDISALDKALDDGTNAIRRLRIREQWPARAAGAVAKTAATLGATVWSR